MWWYAAGPLDPVALEQQQVERERHGSAPSAQPLHRPLRHRDRRHPGRRRQALLRARVGEVHAPGAHLERHAGHRGHAVGHQQGVAVPQAARRARPAGAPRRWTSRHAPRRPSGPGARGREPPSSASFETHSPQSAVTVTTRAPCRRAISEIRRPKKPHWATITVSPGSSRLAIPASMPAVPVQWSGSTSPSGIRYTRRSSSTTSSRISCIFGSRWPSIGRVMASSTAGSTFVGPGPQSSRSGGRSWGRASSMPSGCRKQAMSTS